MNTDPIDNELHTDWYWFFYKISVSDIGFIKSSAIFGVLFVSFVAECIRGLSDWMYIISNCVVVFFYASDMGTCEVRSDSQFEHDWTIHERRCSRFLQNADCTNHSRVTYAYAILYPQINKKSDLIIEYKVSTTTNHTKWTLVDY